MEYTFEIIGTQPILAFFNYQQTIEHHPQRSTAYVGSYQCRLDALIEATQTIPHKPNWNWDRVVEIMVQFWVQNEDRIQQWKQELDSLGNDGLIVARVANIKLLRSELEQLLKR
jgi:hypothetical protein